MLVVSKMPILSWISEAGITDPYPAIALDLDPVLIADVDMALSAVECSEEESAAANLYDLLQRLIQLLERPRFLAVLQQQIVREIHHWLMLDNHGSAVRNLSCLKARFARFLALLHYFPMNTHHTC